MFKSWFHAGVGSVSAYWRFGALEQRLPVDIAIMTSNNDQQISTKLMTLFERPYADSPVRFPPPEPGFTTTLLLPAPLPSDYDGSMIRSAAEIVCEYGLFPGFTFSSLISPLLRLPLGPTGARLTKFQLVRQPKPPERQK